jgi:hypothetical protein
MADRDGLAGIAGITQRVRCTIRIVDMRLASSIAGYRATTAVRTWMAFLESFLAVHLGADRSRRNANLIFDN